MNTDDFDYVLPPELIAQEPADRREEARMLVLHRARNRIEHRRVSNLPEFLHAPDLLVMNNTRVIPARLFGRKANGGGKVELLLLEELEPGLWDALLKTSRRPKPGAPMLFCDDQLEVELVQDGERGRCTIRLKAQEPLMDLLEKHGIPPLPPYIARNPADSETIRRDQDRYQTVYAEVPGAVAAPTAGLHFTPELLHSLENQGVEQAQLTLHVGIGTFRPVHAERIQDHRMDEERYQVSVETQHAIRTARATGGRIVAVGSTSVRTLETVATPLLGSQEPTEPLSGRTGIYIYPPYSFRVTDAILTNFHLPRSTLLMMMSAFAGRETMLAAYAEAIRLKYRFYSYGDCMLIL